jgi:signal transduction histidine kinase
MGALTLIEEVFAVDLRIDQMLWHQRLGPGDGLPGRMSMLSAISFLLLGSALALLDWRSHKRFWPAQSLALSAGVAPMLGLVGYMYSAVWLFRQYSHSTLAVHTELLLALITASTLCARPDRGVLAVVLSDGPGGLTTRRLLPASVLLPPVLGWLRLEGQRAGWYGLEMGISLFTTAIIIILTSLIYLACAESNRKDAERQVIEERSIRLKAAVDAKDRFLASMSHELRTPLNAIIGYTGTLLMKLPGPLTDEQQKQLRVIQASSGHLLALIADLLDLARLEAGEVKVQLEHTACQDVIEEVIQALRPRAQVKGLELITRFNGNGRVMVRTDRRALKQIVTNLADNAIKYTDRGSVRVEIHKRREDGQELAAIDVVDTGVGIKPEDQPRLFQAFDQIHFGRRERGTGLGLHLCHKLAALIGGRIEFESEYGKGSRFSVLLPGA